jgi:hypothetical protein
LEETVGRFIKVSLDTMLKIETMNPRNSLFASSSLLCRRDSGREGVPRVELRE